MKPIEGRLQTGEHILVRILEKKADAQIVIAKFYEDYGSVDVSCATDMRQLDKTELEDRVNQVIQKNLAVKISEIPREQANDLPNITNVPEAVRRIRTVEIFGFDKRACKDPHVSNTSEIGKFRIIKVKRVGKDRYRFEFSVE
ncbi:hypothetical protein KY320_01760 [Candidatus Woesearchaeota archaeon]|nr:hypothetical protein [Candidatus Woesearchaeota archaeon]